YTYHYHYKSIIDKQYLELLLSAKSGSNIVNVLVHRVHAWNDIASWNPDTFLDAGVSQATQTTAALRTDTSRMFNCSTIGINRRSSRPFESDPSGSKATNIIFSFLKRM